MTTVKDSSRSDRTVPINHTAKGGGYNNKSKRLVLTVKNSDEAGLIVSPLEVEVGESGTATYKVELNSDPKQNVTVEVTSSNSSVATVDTDAGTSGRQATLTFTGGDDGNWDTPQTVTVKGVEDTRIGDRTATITHRSSSVATDYEGLSASVQVTVTDDDATVTVSTTSVTVDEAGGTARYTVKLDGQPTGDVTVAVTSSSGAATVSPGSLTFTPSNWSTLQTVTVTGVDDRSPAGNRSATISHSASGGGYDDVEVPSVSVTVTDDDGWWFPRKR